MFLRHLNLEANESALVLGARGTGKSTLIHQGLQARQSLVINLLEPQQEDLYIRDPDLLARQVRALPQEISHIFIDEIQKVPSLLDVCHSLIESRG